MTKAIARDPIYRRRRFQAEVIELCVRWYITYRLSYRDLVAMMAERGVDVSHTTILRWVVRYVPEFEKRWARYARHVNSSWRVEEISIRERGRWQYLYRAVDKHGKTVDFLLCAFVSPTNGVSKKLAVFHVISIPLDSACYSITVLYDGSLIPGFVLLGKSTFR
jgi:hypothetical protein